MVPVFYSSHQAAVTCRATNLVPVSTNRLILDFITLSLGIITFWTANVLRLAGDMNQNHSIKLQRKIIAVKNTESLKGDFSPKVFKN